MPKFAVYFVPPAEDPFYQLGTFILGYDVRARQAVVAPAALDEALGRDKASWTTICRPYGFHLTICEALECHWTTIPRVEQELFELLECFDPDQPFTLDGKENRPVGIWGEEARKSLVLRYEPNTSLRMLHTLLVARLNPLGIGSSFLKHYLTHPQQDLPAHSIQQIRLFSSPTVFGNWYPHFTVLNPYTGGDVQAMASRLAQFFQPYKHVTVETICLLIQEHNEANWQIYQEFHR